MAEGAEQRKCGKKQSKVLRAFQTKKAVIDEQIDSMKAKDAQKHRDLDSDFIDKMAVMRFRYLKIKKENGGLTEDEEAELQKLLGKQ